MGTAMSLMSKMGVPLSTSSVTDRIFEQFFNKDIKTFEQFHTAYLEAWNKLNAMALGQRYEVPDIAKIKKYYGEWKASDSGKKKELLINKLTNDVKISQTDQSIVLTGLVVPTAAMVLKRTGENVPQIKKFKLGLIPDFLFVPAVTLAALFGVKAVNQRSKPKRNEETG